MPDQRRLRRLAVTSAALAAGTVVLMIGGASPADAAPSGCPVGHDPASTLKSIQCNLQQAGKNLQNQINKWTHPQPTQTAPPAPSGSRADRPDGGGKPPTPQASSAGTGIVPPGAVSPDSGGLRQAVPNDSQTSRFPILVPDQQPQVAGQQALTPVVPETRLMSRAAATTDRQRPAIPPLIIAGASGAAGAVLALNVSYATRRLRRSMRG